MNQTPKLKKLILRKFKQILAGDRYFIKDQYAIYFITCTIVKWIDVFSRSIYKDVIVDSLNYCILKKHVNIYAWVIMSNHIHLVVKVGKPIGMSNFLRDFKKFTSKRIVELIQNTNESRKDWMLDKFSFEARRTRRAKYFKLWTDDNHAIDLSNNRIDVYSKIDYIHQNPVKARIVEYAEDYIYSSAIDYSGKVGLVNLNIL